MKKLSASPRHPLQRTTLDARARVRVLVATERRLLREVTAALLALDSRVEIVALAESGRRAIEAALETRPEVAVLGAQARQRSVLEACRALRKRVPTARVVVVWFCGEDQDSDSLLDAGAAAFVHAEMGATDLVAAVLHAAGGERLIARQAPPLAACGAVRSVGASVAAATLSKREREVLELLSNGLTNREIASRLAVRESTVKTHVRHILHKLALRNRTQAARFMGREIPQSSSATDL